MRSTPVDRMPVQRRHTSREASMSSGASLSLEGIVSTVQFYWPVTPAGQLADKTIGSPSAPVREKRKGPERSHIAALVPDDGCAKIGVGAHQLRELQSRHGQNSVFFDVIEDRVWAGPRRCKQPRPLKSGQLLPMRLGLVRPAPSAKESLGRPIACDEMVWEIRRAEETKSKASPLGHLDRLAPMRP